MGLKNWAKRRKEKKESFERYQQLSDDEIQELHNTEKAAYLKIAKKQVIYRGKINAYKDFPVNESDKKGIDMQENENRVEDSIKEIEVESDEMSELDTDIDDTKEKEKFVEINKPRLKNVYKTIRQM